MGGSNSKAQFDYLEQLLAHKPEETYMVEVEDPNKPPNASNPRRARAYKDALLDVPYAAEGGCPTIWDLFLRGAKKFPQNRCLGTRTFELEDSDASKYKRDAKDKTPIRGAYFWESYEEVTQTVKEFGAGLVALGAKQHDNIGLFSANRAEWVISSLSLYSQNMRVVALYASLGANAVEFIINNGDVTMVCVSKKELAHLLKALPKTKGVTHIIQFDADERYKNVEETIAPADVAAAKELGVELIGFSDVVKLGREKSKEIFPNPAKAEDLAYIMYTSGTTGNPKGAMLLHRNIAAAVGAVPHIFPLNEKDQYLSFLPLAHIFETIAQVSLYAEGGAIGFFQDNIKKLTDDMRAVKPTLFCSVPRVINRMHQVVMAGVAEKNFLVRWYFNKAFQHQADLARTGRPLDPKYDAKVFAALREKMGLDNARVIVSGAAPLPPYLNEFLKVVSNAHVLEGYGMTEAAAANAVCMMGDFRLGHTGPVVPALEVRLEDVEDMNYKHTDPNPRGEICFRGPQVFAGYYKDEANTNATIIDGWLHTGDIGRFNPNGTLSVIDRKKNMFKLSQGEYIAVENVEAVYQKSPVVSQLWVYGNSFKSFLLAVIVPSAEFTAAWLYSKGWWPKADKESTKLTSESFPSDFQTAMENPAHKPEIKAWILEQLHTVDKSLTSFSKIKDVIVESGIDKLGMAFTEANDCLTPTFKMRRPQLLQRYINQLKEVYAANGEPVQKDEKWPGEK